MTAVPDDQDDTDIYGGATYTGRVAPRRLARIDVGEYRVDDVEPEFRVKCQPDWPELLTYKPTHLVDLERGTYTLQ
jgi:hypothetical protein